MTGKEWKMFEDSVHFVKTMGPTYVGIVDHDVLIAAHRELKRHREASEIIRRAGDIEGMLKNTGLARWELQEVSVWILEGR